LSKIRIVPGMAVLAISMPYNGIRLAPGMVVLSMSTAMLMINTL